MCDFDDVDLGRLGGFRRSSFVCLSICLLVCLFACLFCLFCLYLRNGGHLRQYACGHVFACTYILLCNDAISRQNTY